MQILSELQMKEVNAEIIAIGTELLLGEITDTNSVFMARELRDLGVNVFFMTSVGDNRQRIARAIEIALERSQIVITCGGLGPTVDDMTRDAVALATGRPLEFKQDLLDSIAGRFEGFRVKMTANNRQQAFVPEGALVIENPVGTAPCFVVEMDGKVVISLPGVPREMKFIFTERVAPFLREKYALGGAVIKARVLKAAGIGESMLDEAIGRDLLEASNPTVGLAAHSGQVDIRITAKGDIADVVNSSIAEVERLIRGRVGDFLFGVDDDRLESAVASDLMARGIELNVLEVNVPPLVSQLLIPEQTAYSFGLVADRIDKFEALAKRFESAHISYDDLRKTAEQIARLNSDQQKAYIVVVGQENAAGDHADSAAQSALAVSYKGKVMSRAYGFAGNSEAATQFVGTWALSMLWRMLRENDAA